MILNMKSYPPFAFWNRRSPVMPQSTKKNPLERRGLWIYMPKKEKKVDSSQSDAYHCIDANLNIVTQSLTWEWENVEVQFRVLHWLLLTFSAPPATKFIQVDSLSRGEKLAHLMDDHLSLSFYDKTTSFCSFTSTFIFLTFSANIILSFSRTCPPHLCWGGRPNFPGEQNFAEFQSNFWLLLINRSDFCQQGETLTQEEQVVFGSFLSVW